jgi:branched-subunit amino acid aminotransferase/4-amino-4-deoxychorismate lyase
VTPSAYRDPPPHDDAPRVTLNGARPGIDALALVAVSNEGHFTSMIVDDGRVRGLDRHLERLRSATRELFDTDLDESRVRKWMRDVIAARHGRWRLRIAVVSRAPLRERDTTADFDVMMTIAEARVADSLPMRLATFRYERPLPRVKHVGTFGQLHYRRLAQRAGYDDALFVDGGDALSEASIWNIGFVDGERIVWPDAPALEGVSMQLLREAMRRSGIDDVVRRVDRDALRDFRAAFVTNASCPVRAVCGIDDITFGVDDGLMERLRTLHDAHALVAI